MHSTIWRRLDTPGHDACRVDRLAAGWRIAGTAVFVSDDAPAHLSYRVLCDPDWQTASGAVKGWIGERAVELTIERGSDGQWSLNGEPAAHVGSLPDLDLGFTPATNVIPIRRLALAPGQAAEAPAAWLDVTTWTLNRLEQRYQRIGRAAYAYAAPAFDYSATLEVSPAGMVTRYPGLWEAQTGARPRPS